MRSISQCHGDYTRWTGGDTLSSLVLPYVLAASQGLGLALQKDMRLRGSNCKVPPLAQGPAETFGIYSRTLKLSYWSLWNLLQAPSPLLPLSLLLLVRPPQYTVAHNTTRVCMTPLPLPRPTPLASPIKVGHSSASGPTTSHEEPSWVHKLHCGCASPATVSFTHRTKPWPAPPSVTKFPPHAVVAPSLACPSRVSMIFCTHSSACFCTSGSGCAISRITSSLPRRSATM